MAEMAGSMYPVNAEKKACQMGNILWARDGLCCVLKTEMDKCQRLGLERKYSKQGQGLRPRGQDKNKRRHVLRSISMSTEVVSLFSLSFPSPLQLYHFPLSRLGLILFLLSARCSSTRCSFLLLSSYFNSTAQHLNFPRLYPTRRVCTFSEHVFWGKVVCPSLLQVKC